MVGIMKWWSLSVRPSVCPVLDPKSRTEAENWQEGSLNSRPRLKVKGQGYQAA